MIRQNLIIYWLVTAAKITQASRNYEGDKEIYKRQILDFSFLLACSSNLVRVVGIGETLNPRLKHVGHLLLFKKKTTLRQCC